MLEDCEGKSVKKELLEEARKLRDRLKKNAKKPSKGAAVGEDTSCTSWGKQSPAKLSWSSREEARERARKLPLRKVHTESSERHPTYRKVPLVAGGWTGGWWCGIQSGIIGFVLRLGR